MTYNVWIHIEKKDESNVHCLNIGEPIEAGKFDTEAEAENYIENELLHSRRQRSWVMIIVLSFVLCLVAWVVFWVLAPFAIEYILGL